MLLSTLGRHVRMPVVAAALLVAAVPPAAARGPESVADLASELVDAVVNISTSQRITGSDRGVPTPRAPDGSPFQDFFDDFFDERNDDNIPRRVRSLGSGFVVDESGIIITNNHVIEDADEITAVFPDGTELKADLIGTDDEIDIAVLSVKPDKPLTAVRFGDSETIRVGDWVMAIGNPFGLGGSVTLGIVSARNRDIDTGPFDNFIQTDASINRGNSGGPLFNMAGEVVGINTAIISPTGGSIGLGFAVPSETAVGVIQQLREFGETRRGWLGLRVQKIDDRLARGLGLPETEGALVAGVTADGPAEDAGIAAGDVILSFNGVPITDVDQLQRMVADHVIGSEAEVVVRRDEEEKTLTVTLGHLEEAKRLASLEIETDGTGEAALASEQGPFGLRLANLSEAWREQLEIDHDLEGVVVADVAPDSVSADNRFHPGDVIVEIAQTRVATVEEAIDVIDGLVSEGRRSILFMLANRDGDLRFASVTVDR